MYSGEGKDFVVGSIYSLPFANNSYDAVFSIALWHLLGDLRSAASELSRVLKPNSHFLIMTANPGNYSPWTSPYSKTTLVGRRLEGQIELADGSTSIDTLYLYSFEEIENSLKATQLEILRTEVLRNLISIYGKSSA